METCAAMCRAAPTPLVHTIAPVILGILEMGSLAQVRLLFFSFLSWLYSSVVDCFLPSSSSSFPFFQTTMSVLVKEAAITAIFMPPATTLPDHSLVPAMLAFLEMESLALV